MPSFNEHPRRRDSWPPTIIHLDPESELSNAEANATTTDLDNFSSEIDENPFSFFLTSPEDIDNYLDYDDEDLSAGIETPDSSKALPVREISPSSIQRAKLGAKQEEEDEEEYDYGIAVPMTLKEFTNRNSTLGESYRAKGKEERGVGLGISVPARGRAKVRLVPNRNGQGRGQTRSLSARRNTSWRLPSPDIWSIEEEDESEKLEEKRETQLSASAPPSTVIGVGNLGGEKKKTKKRVHWAF